VSVYHSCELVFVDLCSCVFQLEGTWYKLAAVWELMISTFVTRCFPVCNLGGGIRRQAVSSLVLRVCQNQTRMQQALRRVDSPCHHPSLSIMTFERSSDDICFRVSVPPARAHAFAPSKLLPDFGAMLLGRRVGGIDQL
jgi:hypothetical protein